MTLMKIFSLLETLRLTVSRERKPRSSPTRLVDVVPVIGSVGLPTETVWSTVEGYRSPSRGCLETL